MRYRVKITWGECCDWVTLGFYETRRGAVRALHAAARVMRIVYDGSEWEIKIEEIQ